MEARMMEARVMEVRVMEARVDGKRRRGRPRSVWEDTTKEVFGWMAGASREAEN